MTEQKAIALPTELPAIPHATTNEKLIVGKLVADLLAFNLTISVDDGGDVVLERSMDPAAIHGALSSTDSDSLLVHSFGGRYVGFVFLVWGNDVDVISDYSMALDGYLEGAKKLANELEGQQ